MTDDSTSPPLTVIDDLRALSPIPQEGLGHTTALTHPDVRVVILTFAAGHVLKEHSAPFPLLLQALDGELIVRAGGQENTLRPGGLLRLDDGMRHEVEAITPSRLMLTLVTR
ncbi:MAG TPA: cupin domain-containing protein [Terrimesophilobacter sp.]|nr:cupin domain-containing protein [Terrimesophilobacter sp.]